MKYESDWFGSSLETEEPVWRYEKRQTSNPPGYVGGSLRGPSGPSINCEAWTDMGNPVPPWARGLQFHPNSTRDLLLEVPVDAPPISLFRGAWFLITSALKRMVKR